MYFWGFGKKIALAGNRGGEAQYSGDIVEIRILLNQLFRIPLRRARGRWQN